MNFSGFYFIFGKYFYFLLLMDRKTTESPEFDKSYHNYFTRSMFVTQFFVKKNIFLFLSSFKR